MRRVKKSIVVVTMMFFSMMLFSMTNVHAANKKLKEIGRASCRERV